MVPVHVGELCVQPVVVRVVFTPYSMAAILAHHRDAVQLAARLVGTLAGGVVALPARCVRNAAYTGGLGAVARSVGRSYVAPLVQEFAAVLSTRRIAQLGTRLIFGRTSTSSDESGDEDDEKDVRGGGC